MTTASLSAARITQILGRFTYKRFINSASDRFSPKVTELNKRLHVDEKSENWSEIVSLIAPH